MQVKYTHITHTLHAWNIGIHTSETHTHTNKLLKKNSKCSIFHSISTVTFNKIQIEEKHPIILCDKDDTFYRYEINTLYL